MPKQFDALGLIGRFQGPHKAHFELLERAGKMADKVIVIIGSADQPRTTKNPWTVAERIAMLAPELVRLKEFTGAEYVVESNIDTLYDDDGWVVRVQSIVDKHTKPTQRIGLIGHAKDMETKRYLDMFPQWESVGVELIEVLDATQIREIYFSDKFNPNFLTGVMPPSVIGFLTKFRESEHYSYIMSEHKVITDRRKAYASLPFPHMATTVDSVVTQSGHILLIKRRAAPGRGLWALPGGYFNAGGIANLTGEYTPPDMTPLDAIIRELREETCIDLPDKVLRGSVKTIEYFCHPNRSMLGRSGTFAAHIPLSGGEWKFPKVKGADDAEKAKWFPFIDVKREFMFDDHYDIITHFVPLLK